ncbi:Zinc finger, FYVE/PHD-type [Plasmopara halstedii]|uniref:Zinc finger, FYVE/PHD-type n=1 Tax=Plasmopara halstedii TaxID=4781 RepID=A0A0P1A9X4_PLAHL|nr:Zinc finger, FYVE/PHD-type [Plasmopara halstedii]CEG37085.1 Zinc finger, FYVE/PHD-type [Plasmopara halstedii]|eukprot:XP_024573454.1 Zinc finger, FYVE/PHD-type [Plasmopara halstedii]
MEHYNVVYPPKPLNLSSEEEFAVEQIADRLVAETLHASEDFAAEGHVADPSCWKRVKEKDNMVAYQNVSGLCTTKRGRFWSEDTVVVTASPQNPTLFPTGHGSFEDAMFIQSFHNVDDYDSKDERGLHHDEFTKFGAKDGAETSVLEKFRPTSVPTVFMHGSFPGTVEDMALAFLADTDERSRTRFNTIKEAVVEDVRILAQIQGPTQEDPFRFLGIKWCTSMPSRAVSLVVKPRDYLIIEATGMAFDSNGVRFTYMLHHSIEREEVPNFWEFGLMRIVFSACHVMKPREDGETVDAYARGFLISNDSLSVRLNVTHFAEGLVAIPDALEEAYFKKLTWMLYDQRRWSASSSSGSDSSSFRSSNSSASLVEKISSCPCCHGKLSSRRLGVFLDKSSGCRLCRKVVCHKCTVKKYLPGEGARGRYMKKIEQEYCLTCYLKAKRLSAWHVAVATLLKSAP